MNFDIGSVFERTFEIYRRQAAVLLPAAVILYLVIGLIYALVLTGGGLVAILLAIVVSYVGGIWYEGAVVTAVKSEYESQPPPSIGGLFAAVTPALGSLLVIGLLAGIGIGIGFVLLIVPGLILLTIWALIAPVIVIERGTVFGAFERSRQLVSGNAWAVFGVVVLIAIASFIVSFVLRSILGSTSFTGLLIAQFIAGVVVAPINGIAASVMYFSLRGAPVATGAAPPPPPAPVGGSVPPPPPR